MLLARLTVDEDRVALAEGAPLGVLAGQTDRGALQEEGADREGLAHAPVDRAVLDHRRTALQLRQQTRVHVEVVGDVDLGLGDALDDLGGDRGRDRDGEAVLRVVGVAGAGCAVASRTSVKTFSSWPW